tara:strand:+ start:11640 stop:11795 length:156 start_codon:yes stop_codon:yes gene_type:complete
MTNDAVKKSIDFEWNSLLVFLMLFTPDSRLLGGDIIYFLSGCLCLSGIHKD